MLNWYVVYTQPSKEQLALHHLQNQGFDVYMPRYRKERRHARRIDHVLSPLFPRYLFIRIDLQQCGWRSINGTRGVSYILSQGDEPVAVPSEVIETIQNRENDEGLFTFTPPKLNKGDRFNIMDGAFADNIGIFEKMDGSKRVVLLLELLGRIVRVRTPLKSLAAIS